MPRTNPVSLANQANLLLFRIVASRQVIPGPPLAPYDVLTITLTAAGEALLRGACGAGQGFERTNLINFPAQNFDVRDGQLFESQLSSLRPSYVNAILLASRGRARNLPNPPVNPPRTACPRTVFSEIYREPGYFNGCCAGHKFQDGCARCPFTDPSEGVNPLPGSSEHDTDSDPLSSPPPSPMPPPPRGHKRDASRTELPGQVTSRPRVGSVY